MSSDSADPLRSWLFAPANRARRVEKALRGAAHAVILDLEDGVPMEEKICARAALRGMLETSRRPNTFVRINALDTSLARDDVETVVRLPVRGIVLPKTEATRDIQILDWLMGHGERLVGLAMGSIEIVPLLETAMAFENLAAICRSSPRVRRISLGAADFTLDLGLRWSDDEHELMPWRSAMVLASRAAGLEPPVDTPWINVDDDDGMAASALRSHDHGFAGKLCIHPDQVFAIHRAYAPDQSQIDEAARIVAAFEVAGFAATKVDGRMIDGPVVEVARRILREAGAIGAFNPIPD